MATPQENAALSDAVYGGPGNTQAPAGWRLIRESPRAPGNEGSPNGYYGAAFQNEQTGEIVIANRGSRMSGEGLRQDWAGSDVQIARQNPDDVPEAFNDARNFADSVQTENPGAPVSYTGHSLGGAEAQYQAATLGGNATTFGAPGVRFAVSDEQARAAEGRVTNFVLPGDPVPLSGQHVGQTVMLTPSGGTIAKDIAAVGIGLAVGGLVGLVIALAGVAATHMLGNYIDALAGMAMPPMPSVSVAPFQSRMGDPIACVLHGAGVITTGFPTVLVGGQPAARMTDLCPCLTIIPNAIAKGSMTVLIGGLPAARLGDLTTHGPAVAFGLPTVMTGG